MCKVTRKFRFAQVAGVSEKKIPNHQKYLFFTVPGVPRRKLFTEKVRRKPETKNYLRGITTSKMYMRVKYRFIGDKYVYVYKGEYYNYTNLTIG